MFTGIVQGMAKVVDIEKRPLLHRLTISFPTETLQGLAIGASIAINGTCLTVVSFSTSTHEAQFDVMIKSLSLSNIGQLETGDLVNFERAAKIGDEIGGHMMSGHIFGTCKIQSIQQPENNVIIEFNKSEGIKPYIFDKGFIGLNGCSLTVAEVKAHSFSVYLIPETLSTTTFGQCTKGDEINIELDTQTQTIVDTLQRMRETGQLNIN